jgi:hypothetical protein
MQALTVRGIEALEPQAKRYEVFDADTRQHGAQRLESTVAHQPEQIPPKRSALRDVAKAILEWLHPGSPLDPTTPARAATARRVPKPRHMYQRKMVDVADSRTNRPI